MTNQFSTTPDLCWTDKRRGSSGQTNTNPIGTIGNFKDESSIDTRLTAISGTAYSAANLKIMNLNDKIWALRQVDESAGI